MSSRLKQLGELGQAVWLDFIDRKFLRAGGLRSLIEAHGVTGVTSNPSIFEKAIGGDDAYDNEIKALLATANVRVQDIYENLVIADTKAAAADLRPTYERTSGRDGFVSLELSPGLADLTDATIAEARRLWTTVNEPNLMVKVPGTAAALPAIRLLIAEGVNINVTLLFSLEAYQAVAEAYLAGLEARVEAGLPVDRIASVASFFVSRIDMRIDEVVDARMKAGDHHIEACDAIRGKVAVASAKLAYAWYREMISGARWQALAARGAMPQRLLWASTGMKSPAFPDTLYVDTLIGPETVNTMAPGTMDAFIDHGTVEITLPENIENAHRILAEAQRLGLEPGELATDLLSHGIARFADAMDRLLVALADKRALVLGDRQNAITAALPAQLARAVAARLETARTGGWARRLWQGDSTLWTGRSEGQWLGWLSAADVAKSDVDRFESLRAKAKAHRDAVLLGMGGSSLGPEVLSLVLGSSDGNPRLHVLDTTDPDEIAAISNAINPDDCIFIIASKSGTTMEPELLRSFFWELSGGDGSRFIAVTDPGSKLATSAGKDRFAMIFEGDPTIGGRYSVLSAFGMVPAAVMGIDTRTFLASTEPMVQACGDDVPAAGNPGIRLGAIIGEAAIAGRDKLTILASAELAPLGAWLEQLLAESTGKQGKGIIPVDLEPIGTPESYGGDRLFIYLHLAGNADQAVDGLVKSLIGLGQPVVTIMVAKREFIGQEFFRWEVATAVAAAVIGVNPFDQPDVEDAKIATRRLVANCEATGALEPRRVAAENADIQVLTGNRGESATNDPVELLRQHFAGLEPGGYAGFLAYVERSAANAARLAEMRTIVRDAKGVATVAGFGPRFLHSTGQAYKGGPGSGVFLVITRDPYPDLAIPGRRTSFGTVQVAQARGDAEVLESRGRRVLCIHLKQGGGGMVALVAALQSAMS